MNRRSILKAIVGLPLLLLFPFSSGKKEALVLTKTVYDNHRVFFKNFSYNAVSIIYGKTRIIPPRTGICVNTEGNLLKFWPIGKSS